MLNSATPHRPSLLAIAPRVLVITFAVSALVFALLLLVGIVGTALWYAVHGQPLVMTHAYRSFAIPAVKVVAAVTFICAVILEIRHYLKARSEAAAALNQKGQP
jgi:membrane protein YdbS with pleckstrin-like domain